MEHRHLRYFVAVAEERSFTRAAERLWVAQPSLSTQIRDLERELGVQLFERHSRGVDLTEAGHLFLSRARDAIAAVDAATSTGRDIASGMVGAIKLGIATEARWSRTIPVLTRFANERSCVDLTVVEAYGGTLRESLRDRGLDAVLAAGASADPELERLDLGVEPLAVLMSSRHPLAGEGPLAVELLAGERVVVTGHRDRSIYDQTIARMLSDHDVWPAWIPSPPGPALHAAMADGRALRLTTAPHELSHGLTARALAPAMTLGFELLWRRHAGTPALAEFVRVTQSCRDHCLPGPRPLAAVA